MDKYCPHCKQIKPVSEFNKRGGKRQGEYSSHCKVCNRKYVSDWQKTPKGKRCQERARLKYKFGITPKQLDALLTKQQGVCAICGQCEAKIEFRSGKVMSLSIDHSHKTGQVRGLLCQKCNSIIGYANEDVNTLQKVISYLEKHN